jgi:hypothetical protein
MSGPTEEERESYKHHPGDRCLCPLCRERKGK